MTRSVRLAVGVVVVVVLLMVSVVSALVLATALLRLSPTAYPAEVAAVPPVELRDPVEVPGRVLDVDEDQTTGYASMEVAFDDGAGGTEVATVELGLIDGTPLPQVGGTVDLVHERDDPRQVFLTDDPALLPAPEGDLDRDGVPDGGGAGGQDTSQEQRDAARVLARRFGLLAAAALVAALVAAALTVVAVCRAPRPAPAPQPWAVR